MELLSNSSSLYFYLGAHQRKKGEGIKSRSGFFFFFFFFQFCDLAEVAIIHKTI
jgi:hypothetical protein